MNGIRDGLSKPSGGDFFWDKEEIFSTKNFRQQCKTYIFWKHLSKKKVLAGYKRNGF